MRLRAIQSGDPERIMAAEIIAAERAVTLSMRQAGSGLQKDWRDQIRTAGLGRRLTRTIRLRVYPEHEESAKAAALVWTKAPQIIAGFEKGALIRAKDGFWSGAKRTGSSMVQSASPRTRIACAACGRAITTARAWLRSNAHWWKTGASPAGSPMSPVPPSSASA